MELQDLIGKKFGRLKVLKRLDNIGKHVQWECICDCGNKKNCLTTNLKQGKTKSCGCLRNELGAARLKTLPRKKLPPGVGSCNFLWNRYKQGAKKRNIEFNLSKEDFMMITSGFCFYCDVGPKQVIESPRGNGKYYFNGIDRYDNKIGYILQNCVSCCEICNYAKNDRTPKEFYEWIDRLVKFKTSCE